MSNLNEVPFRYFRLFRGSFASYGLREELGNRFSAVCDGNGAISGGVEFDPWIDAHRAADGREEIRN